MGLEQGAVGDQGVDVGEGREAGEGVGAVLAGVGDDDAAGGRLDHGALDRGLGHVRRREPALEGEAVGAEHRDVDEALWGIDWAISQDPERFDPVPGLTTRVAFTARRGPIPALKLFLKILEDGQVELLWIEVEEEEEEFFYEEL